MPPKKSTANSKTQSKAVKISARKSKSVTKDLGRHGPAQPTRNAKPGQSHGKAPSVKSESKTKWSKEDQHALVIQKAVKRYLAKRQLQRLRKEKEDYENLMIKLEKEAWLQMVQREREEEEKERLKEQEERKRKALEMKWKKQILEASFDGENDVIEAVLNEAIQKMSKQTESKQEQLARKCELSLVNCEDANGNTPLSEAAAGGHIHTIFMLLLKGGEVNSRGRYDRTPLWRAAFAGHQEAVQMLLEHGADPRLNANDGTSPEQVAAVATVEQTLKSWDTERTIELLKKLEEEREKKREADEKHRKEECNKLEGEIQVAEKEMKASQMLLEKSHCELNRRIFEHDKCMATGDENKISITLQTVHDAEKQLEKTKERSEKARQKLAKLKLKLREQRKEIVADEGEDHEVVGIKVSIKELDDVLMKDVGGRIAESGRWPLVIDTSPQTSTFLRYRDTNFINALNPRNMDPDVIRISLLGAIRYGKPLVLDMMAVDMFDSLKIKFDDVEDGLLNLIMTKEILKDNRFLSLVKPEDGEQYSKTAFLGARIENFKFIILTQLWNPSSDLVQQTYPLKVISTSKTF